MDDYRAAVDFLAGRYPDLEMWAAGFSFGSYIAMTSGADDDRICALIGIAPPVNRYEFASVKLSTKPKFIVHGESDELIPLKAVREFYAQLQEPKEFVEIDRANHLFDGQASEVGDALEELLDGFHMREAVIVSATRTAVGKAPNGALRTVRPDEMAAAVIGEVLASCACPANRRTSTT